MRVVKIEYRKTRECGIRGVKIGYSETKQCKT